jgi:hypothetical protein
MNNLLPIQIKSINNEVQKIYGMDPHIFGLCVYYVIKKYGIIIKFVVYMGEEIHI